MRTFSKYAYMFIFIKVYVCMCVSDTEKLKDIQKYLNLIRVLKIRGLVMIILESETRVIKTS